MPTLAFPLLTVFCISIGIAHAAPPELQGPYGHLSTQTQFYPQAGDYSSAAWRLDAEVETKLTLSEWSLKLTPWGWLKGPYDVGGNTNSTKARGELKEGYLERTSSVFDLRAGNQIITWGRADKINPTDVIHPHDYEDLFFESPRGNKLPVLALRGVFHPPEAQIEFVVLPLFKPALIPLDFPKSGTRALDPTDSRWLSVLPREVATSSSRIPLQYELTQATMPRTLGYGMRANRDDWEGFGFSISAFNGVEETPRIAITQRGVVTDPSLPVTITLHPSYHRFTMVGFDAERSVKLSSQHFGLRLESAVTLRDNSRVSGLDPEFKKDLMKDDTLHTVLGIDTTLPKPILGSYVYLNLQFVSYDRLGSLEQNLGRNTSISVPEFLPWDKNAVLYVENRFGDLWKTTQRLIVSFEDGDFYYHPVLSHQLSDEWKAALGADFFLGSEDGFYGQYQRQSRGFLTVSVTW